MCPPNSCPLRISGWEFLWKKVSADVISEANTGGHPGLGVSSAFTNWYLYAKRKGHRNWGKKGMGHWKQRWGMSRKPWAARRCQGGRFFPRAWRRLRALPTRCSQTSSLQNCEQEFLSHQATQFRSICYRSPGKHTDQTSVFK